MDKYRRLFHVNPGHVGAQEYKELLKQFLVVIFLLVLTVLVRLPSISIPLQSDEGAAAYNARLILQGEPLYGSHHPCHHLPALYYSYALIFQLLGDRSESIKIALIPVIFLTAVLLYQIGRQSFHWKAGLLASVFFLTSTALPGINGETAVKEQFANLPITLVIWFAVCCQSRRAFLIYVFIGAASAISFLYKAINLHSICAVVGALFLMAVLERSARSWRGFLKKIAAILLGVLLILVPVAAYFAWLGLLPRLLLIFQMGDWYVGKSTLPLWFVFLLPFAALIRTNLVLTCIGLIGFIQAIKFLLSKNIWVRKGGLENAIISIWFITSLAAAGASRLRYGHYALLVIPPLAILSSWAIATLSERLSMNHGKGQFVRSLWIPALVMVAIFTNYYLYSGNYFQGYIDYLRGMKERAQFVVETIGANGLEEEEIATYIRQNTKPEDQILTWTGKAAICYMAERRSSSDTLWPMYIPFLGPPERVIAAKPAFIVTENEESELPAWLGDELVSSYKMDMKIGRHRVYRRFDQQGVGFKD